MREEEIRRLHSGFKDISNFYWGIIFGLVFGIVGNLFVSHFYGSFSIGVKFHMGEERLFYWNLFFAIGLFVIMVVISYFMYRRIKHLEYLCSTLEKYYLWKKGEEENED